MKGSENVRRYATAPIGFRRRRRWRATWMRPRLRWVGAGALGAMALAAVASAGLATVTAAQKSEHPQKASGATGPVSTFTVGAPTVAHTPATAQYVALTAAKPGISITENPPTQKVELGGTASFTITVVNTGTVTLHDVYVDPPVRSCDRPLGTLAAHHGMRYTCTFPGVTKGLVNPVTVIGISPAGTKVVAHDSAKVIVVLPKATGAALTPPTSKLTPTIAVNKLPHVQTVTSRIVHTKSPTGTHTAVMHGYAWFTITVKNPGRVALTDVTVKNAQSPGCDRHFARLAPGAAHSYRCWTLAIRNEPANLSIVYGKSKLGPVKASAKAAILVRTKTVNTGAVQFAG